MQILQQYSTNFRHVLQPPQSTFLCQTGRIFLFSFFQILGVSPKIQISGIRADYDSMGIRLMHISVSNFAAIFNKLQACATTSTEHFLGSSRKNFSFFIFLQEFFWAATLQIIYEKFGPKFTKKNTISGFLSKTHPILKKKWVELEFGCG